jgi:mannobiose 2-epimerase
MNKSSLEDYLVRIEADVRENILPFWMKHAVSDGPVGFRGEVSNDLVTKSGEERGGLLTSRILWTYSAAHRRDPRPEYLEMARRAYEDLFATFWDNENGGVYWSVTESGEPLQDRKQIYGQAFALYALSEYFRVTDDRSVLEKAIAQFRLLDGHARDPKNGGYFEAYSRDWSILDDVRLSAVDMNEPKSQNTNLHVMEAFTNLLRVWPDPVLRERQTELLGVMLDHVIDSSTLHLGLFFDESWKLKTDQISYGHDIEAAWLLQEAADVLGGLALTERIRKLTIGIAEVTLAEGVAEDGSIYYLGDTNGLVNHDREWWLQAEAVVGFLNAFQNSGEERFLEAALRCWDYIEQHVIDRENGEWFWLIKSDGTVNADKPKIGFWKCPYHNARACFEASDRLRAIIDR